jgi:hypothetical protein
VACVRISVVVELRYGGGEMRGLESSIELRERTFRESCWIKVMNKIQVMEDFRSVPYRVAPGSPSGQAEGAMTHEGLQPCL